MVAGNKKIESVALVPEHASKGITQKKAIEIWIPHLFVLREKGCSWRQITYLLNDKCGFNLQPSTVRSYFGELLPKQIDACRNAMAEHLLEMGKIKNLKCS